MAQLRHSRMGKRNRNLILNSQAGLWSSLECPEQFLQLQQDPNPSISGSDPHFTLVPQHPPPALGDSHVPNCPSQSRGQPRPQLSLSGQGIAVSPTVSHGAGAELLLSHELLPPATTERHPCGCQVVMGGWGGDS